MASHGESSLSGLSSDIDVLVFPATPTMLVRQPQHAEKGIYCHHCHRRCDTSSVLRCTGLKHISKHAPVRVCNRAFCVRDLKNRYNTDASEIMTVEQYLWTCPCCRGICQESSCRKKRLEATSDKAKPTPIAPMLVSDQGVAKQKSKKLVTQAPNPIDGPRTNQPKIKEQRAKKVEAVPDAPIFERVDTRLDHEGILRRIQLREYLFRFRTTLSIPERCLFAVDDFDRPLTEASVRLFGGAMLDMIKEESVEEVDDLFRYREEIRYYADLARFAAIFTLLIEPLGLTMPPSDRLNGGRQASRIPQPDEVLQMLLALAERTLATPLIRADIDSTAGEAAERRQYAKDLKAEGAAWERERKRLSAAELQAKTPIEGMQHREHWKQSQKEHDLALVLLNVNLRATIGRRAMRYEPLGSDNDGRIYYTLSIRPIDEGKPPMGWASGLLVWGKGVTDEDDLPARNERWSHFGGSVSVRQLIKWLRYRQPLRLEVIPQKRPFASEGMSDGLLEKLGEVAEWLEVLEWKGLGEM